MKEIKGDTNMEKYNKTVAQKNQYSENEYTNQTIYRFQCNPYEAHIGIFHRTRTNITICMGTQKTLNSQ